MKQLQTGVGLPWLAPIGPQRTLVAGETGQLEVVADAALSYCSVPCGMIGDDCRAAAGSEMTLPRVERRLAAIMVADVVGYSRMVEADEAGTLAAIRDLRHVVLEPLLAEHRGRLVKIMGDGLIAEFGSIVGAVACAAAVQAQVASSQHQVPSERRIVLRIGVNLGDVVIDGDDLLGDGINVAARLEQLCPPGGVLISGAAHDQLPGKLDVRFGYAGEQRLKNITRPVRAYRMVLDGSPSTALATFPLADKPAVAVMPFENMSGDSEQSYFSDGITEDVITELSRSRTRGDRPQFHLRISRTEHEPA